MTRRFTPGIIAGIITVSVLMVICCTNPLRSGGTAEIARAIPENAVFIVKISQPVLFAEALSGKAYGPVIAEHLLVPELTDHHAKVSDFLRTLNAVAEDGEVPLLSSVHLSGAETLSTLHYFPLKAGKKAFRKLLGISFPEESLQTWNYEGVEFHEVLLESGNGKMTVAHTQGLLIASPVPFLVEDAVKQLKSSHSLLSDPGFRRIHRKETDAAHASIWVPCANARSWMSLFASEEGLDLLEGFRQFASWMLLDVYFNEDNVFFSGLTSAEEGTTLSLAGATSPCNTIGGEAAWLPSSTAAFSQLGPASTTMKDALNEIGLGACITEILSEPLHSDLAAHRLWLFHVQQEEAFSEAKGNQTADSVLSALLLQGGPVHYYLSGDRVVAAGNKKVLDQYRQNTGQRRVLSGDAPFLQLAETAREDAVASAYFRNAFLGEAYHAIYESREEAKADRQLFKGFSQGLLQFSPQGDVYQTTGMVVFDESDAGGRSGLAWQARLDAPVLAGPQVIATDEEGTYGVFVQDTLFNLYLLDKGGNQVWKRALDSEWLGEVSSLHLFEGSDRQFTLNTRGKWYLVDNDGHDLAGFPLRFKEEASAGMALAARGKEHLVFIPMVNGHLYGYELSGKPLPGWNPKEKAGRLEHPPSILFSGKDGYVTAMNAEGVAYIWNLKGRRLARNAFGEPFPSDLYVDQKPQPFKIKSVRENGEIVSMNPRGRVGRYQLSARNVRQFLMEDIRGNSAPEIILSDGSTIRVFDYQGQLQWKKDYRGSIRTVELPGSDRAVLALLDPAAQALTLIDGNGKALLGEGINCGAQYTVDAGDLLGQGQAALLTGSDDAAIRCYRLAVPGD